MVSSEKTSITDRKALQGEPNGSLSLEWRYELMSAISQDIILFVRTESGQILEANAAAERAYGYSRAELLGKSIYELRADPSPDLVSTQLARANTTGIVFETIHRRKDGSLFPVEVRSKGEMIGGERILVSVIRDISERKHSEQAIRENEGHYRNLFTSMSEGFSLHEIICDEQGEPIDYRFLEVNPAFERVTGLKRDFVIGKKMSEIFPEDERWRIKIYGKVALQGEPAHFEMYSNTLKRYYDMVSYCPKHGQFAVISLNITQRKQAEEDLKKLTRAVEFSPASVVITDVEGRIEYVNPKFSQLTGYSIDEARGQNPRILKSEQTPETTYPNLWDTIRAGDTWQGQFVNKKKDGTLYWESASISPITNEKGEITHYIAVKEDITAQKRLEQEVQNQRDFAVQVMNLMGQGLTVTGPDGCYRYTNPAFAHMVDIAQEDLMGHRPAEWIEKSSAAIFQNEEASQEMDAPDTYEAHLKRPGGQTLPVLITEVPLWRDGQRVGAISVVTDLSEQKLVEEQLRRMSTIDVLTGAYNRTHFEAELARIQTSREAPISFVVADVDNLKQTNDTLGHSVGDILLQRAVTVLQSAVRTSDVVARTGGDEFAIILAKTGENEVAHILRRIQEMIGASNRAFPEYALSLSLGAATVTGGDVVSALKLADSRMYEDKRARKLNRAAKT
jgi:diguanylate cyclase (GGDEF)-like protein/PAS domain S-box-containing protein